MISNFGINIGFIKKLKVRKKLNKNKNKKVNF